ncbi:MAG: hypothetical protein COB04_17250 [Gammaproteobacteria bacterium]|nr:MAG: hypothetical protein COB04_17250 [Gammaproteobacteria bacterium]
MSYILEALKKSERERNIDEIPTISPYNAAPAIQSNRTFYLLIGLVVLLSLALAVVFYWTLSSRPADPSYAAPIDSQRNEHIAPPRQARLDTQLETQPSSNAPKAIRQAFTPSNSIVIRPTTPRASELEPKPKPKSKSKPKLETATATRVSPELITPSRPRKSAFRDNSQAFEIEGPRPLATSLFDMPSEFKRQIPRLKYASHWYAKDPVSRTVIINSRSLREGDWVNDSIQVMAISEEHVTLASQQESFSLPALVSWQP